MFLIASIPITLFTYPFVWVFKHFKPAGRGAPNIDKHIESLKLNAPLAWNLGENPTLTEFRLRAFKEGDGKKKIEHVLENVFSPIKGEVFEDGDYYMVWLVDFPKHSKFEQKMCKTGKKDASDLRLNKIFKSYKTQKSKLLMLDADFVCVSYREAQTEEFRCSVQNTNFMLESLNNEIDSVDFSIMLRENMKID